MKLKTRKLVMSTLVGPIAVAIAGLAVADVTIRLRPNHNFVVEDRDGRVDNFIVKDQGQGVEVPRGSLDIKNKTFGGEIKFYEGSGGKGSSVTVKSPDVLVADVTYTLPDTEGGGGQLLQTDGSGVLSWVGSIGTGCDSGEDIVDLTVPATRGGRTWMDRNLGASRRAKTSNDTASYGGMFQWGRGRDGHECSWRTTFKGPVKSSAVGKDNLWDGKFVTGALDNGNWVSPPNDTLWGNGTTSGIIKGPNDPCPTGYQVPNKDELAALKITGTSDAFELLKLPTNGVRDGTYRIHYVGGGGYYWSSSAIPGKDVYTLDIDNASRAGMQSNSGRNYGYAIRCIKSL